MLDQPNAAIASRTVYLRYVAEADAARILEIRRGPVRAGVLSMHPYDVEAQKAWLAQYATRNASGTEHYFMVCRKGGMAIGTLRVHDIVRDACWWGSWVLAPGSPIAASLESYFMMNWFIFDHLGMRESRFRVPFVNAPVIRFHDAMRSPRVSGQENEAAYCVDDSWYGELKRKHRAHFAGIRVLLEEIS